MSMHAHNLSLQGRRRLAAPLFRLFEVRGGTYAELPRPGPAPTYTYNAYDRLRIAREREDNAQDSTVHRMENAFDGGYSFSFRSILRFPLSEDILVNESFFCGSMPPYPLALYDMNGRAYVIIIMSRLDNFDYNNISLIPRPSLRESLGTWLLQHHSLGSRAPLFRARFN